MGENVFKRCHQKKIKFQNIQTVHTALYQKNKQPDKKIGQKL